MNQAVSLSSYARNNKIRALLLLTGLFLFNHSLAQDDLRGLVFEHDRYDAMPLPFEYGKRYQLPASASVRQFLPRVVNQASNNNGVAWSAVWYAHTILEASVRNLTNDRPGHAELPLSPAFTYRMVNPVDCNAPVSMIDVLESMRRNGAPRFAAYRSFCAGEIDDEVKRTAEGNRLPGYVRLFNSYDPNEAKVIELKKALSNGGAVVAGIICPPSFALAEDFWQPRELDVEEKFGGHAVTVVGYDDLKYGGAFEVVNSWGPGWGNRGFTWIRYADIGRHFVYAFKLVRPGIPLGATVTFSKSDLSPMAVTHLEPGLYELNGTFPTGTEFNVAITADHGAFASALVRDPAGASARIFPADTSTSTFFSRQLWLPGQATYFTLTDPPGKNKLFFVFGDNEETVRSVSSAILAGKPWPRPDGEFSKWNTSEIRFESNEEVVVVMVKLNQG